MLSEVGENTVACIEWGKMESCSRMYYGRWTFAHDEGLYYVLITRYRHHL